MTSADVANFDISADLRGLLECLALSPEDAGGVVTFAGADPIYRSVHRLGAVSALAMMANAVGVAAIWQMRTGRGQNLSIDLRQSIRALNPHYLFTPTINGYRFPMPHGPRNPISTDFYETRDGRTVQPCGSYQHMFYAWLELLGCAPTREAVAASIRRWDSRELDAEAAARRLAFSVCYSPEEWATHPQGRVQGELPVVQLTKIGESEPEPFGDALRPLSDIRVLQNTHAISGSVVGRTLAEQGAEVLQITQPEHVEPAFVYNEANVGMRSAFLDLRDADANRQAANLVTDADVFVENFRHGALDRFGFSPADLASRRPGIVAVTIRCYGEQGPWAERGGHDNQGSCASGFAFAEGAPDSPRFPPTGMLNDFMTGYLGAAGATAALLRRAREGGSYHVSVSLVRTAMWAHDLGSFRREAIDALAGDHLRVGEPETITGATSLGTLRRLGSPIRFSETPPRWEDPLLVVRGSSAPAWLPPETLAVGRTPR